MSIYLGSHKLKELYVGGNKIKEAYLGSIKVYSANAVPVLKQYYMQITGRYSYVSSSIKGIKFDNIFPYTPYTYSTSSATISSGSVTDGIKGTNNGLVFYPTIDNGNIKLYFYLYNDPTTITFTTGSYGSTMSISLYEAGTSRYIKGTNGNFQYNTTYTF